MIRSHEVEAGGPRHLDHPDPVADARLGLDRAAERTRHAASHASTGIRRHERLQRPLSAVGKRHQIERVTGPLAQPAGLDRLRRLASGQRAAELVGGHQDAHGRDCTIPPEPTGKGPSDVTMSREELVGIAHAERQRLGRMVQFADPASWEKASAAAGWWNRDVMAHLGAGDTAAAQLLAGQPAEELDLFRARARDHTVFDRRLERLDGEPARGGTDPRTVGHLGAGRRVAPGARRPSERRRVAGATLPLARRRHRARLSGAVAGRRVVPARRGHARDQRRRRGLAGQLAALAGLPHDRPRRPDAALGAGAGGARPRRALDQDRRQRGGRRRLALGSRRRRGPDGDE